MVAVGACRVVRWRADGMVRTTTISVADCVPTCRSEPPCLGGKGGTAPLGRFRAVRVPAYRERRRGSFTAPERLLRERYAASQTARLAMGLRFFAPALRAENMPGPPDFS